VSAQDDEDEFLLYDAAAVRRLQDRPFFLRAIEQFYHNLARTFGCRITVSERRIGEAHDLWQADVARTLAHDTDEDTTELDHFKNAAFIADWLRRRGPINDVEFLEESRVETTHGQGAETAPSSAQIQFYQYGAELCALYVGFYICLAYEVYAMAEREIDTSKTRVISDAVGVRAMPRHFQSEFPRLLKTKDVSAHALYMIYRSLFDTLEWEINGRVLESAPA
jgi:hypothetical protein